VDTLTAALDSATGTWATPQVEVDWANDGYDGDGTIDDLSALVGAITIHQSLDDGLPSDITYTSGSDSTSSATWDVGGSGSLRPEQYWSPDNTNSPIASYERDVAAVSVALGAITDVGPQRATVFTGQMSDAPIQGRQVTVDAVSKTRLKMTKAIQAPPIYGDKIGLTATWPVSWAATQCGVYASPPPRGGCRLWAPMHGSAQPFLPAIGRKDTTSVIRDLATGLTGPRPIFTDGPFVAAIDCARTLARAHQLDWTYIPVAPGADLLTTVGNAGRVEFWVRGDSTDAVGSPAALAALDIVHVGGAFTRGGVDLNRHAFMRVNDGAGHTVTLTSVDTLPTDGNWYFVGAAYDIAAKKLWVTNFNGTTTSTGAPTLTTGSLPGTENYDPDNLGDGLDLFACLPIAEFQLTSGAQANPDNFPWINSADFVWTQGAVIRNSTLSMQALAETTATEAWAFASNYAQADLAATRTDELDRFNYLPASYWTETAQATIADTISTSVNAGTDLAASKDLTKIRNSVTVNYQTTRVDGDVPPARSLLHVGFTVYTLPPGTTTIVATFTSPAVSVEYVNDGSGMYIINATDVANGEGPARNFISANTAADGSGTYATAGQIVAKVTSWDAGKATVTVVNTTGTTYYTVNSGVVPYLNINGSAFVAGDATVTVEDSTSVAARGVRGLTFDAKVIQDATTANALATTLKNKAGTPLRQVTVTVRGDPRRQPGDLIELADPTATNIAGTWRILTIDHSFNGPEYTQALTLVESTLFG
jgi:hypothetical protein